MSAPRIAALAALALVAACGKEDRDAVLEQPPGCVEAIEPAAETPTVDDVVLGEAILLNLKKYQRVPWRELWLPRERFGMVKLPIIVPAGQTLTLRVPPTARGIIGLDYQGPTDPQYVTQAATQASFTACYGRFPTVHFPGRLLLARRVCGVPLDWRYGDQRGRLRLSFGRACRR